MTDDWRGTVAALTLVIGSVSAALFGTSAPIAAIVTAISCWVALGIRTGWWVGTREDVDGLVLDFMRKMRFFRDVKDQRSAEQESTPAPPQNPQPLD